MEIYGFALDTQTGAVREITVEHPNSSDAGISGGLVWVGEVNEMARNNKL